LELDQALLMKHSSLKTSVISGPEKFLTA